MINNLILVGRIVEDVKLVTLDTGQKVASMVLAVQRSFKNVNDEYDTDFIPVQLWLGAAELASEYCTKGSIVGIKGRVAVKYIEIQGTKIRSVDIIGERIAFINMKKNELPE